jgi:uncharacterized protein
MEDGEFEWDDAKEAENFAKHHISFEAARFVFDDALAVDWLDESEDYGEERYNIVGMVVGRLLFGAYTLRGETKTRIISARKATPHERRSYHEKKHSY